MTEVKEGRVRENLVEVTSKVKAVSWFDEYNYTGYLRRTTVGYQFQFKSKMNSLRKESQRVREEVLH